MTDSYANSTALLVAALRAAASNHPDPICSDPWAAALVGDSGQQLAERCLQATPHMDLWVAVRTAYIDAHVRTWANAQRPQVVLLSTGLDTRAARLAEDALRFFEVDGPEQLADKQTRIADLEDYPDDASTAVPCNLSEQSVIDALVDGGFDLDDFGIEGIASSAERRTASTALVERIVKMQRPNGGFGLWPGSHQASPYATVHALWALHLAQEGGMTISKQVINRATSYLRNSL
ncbi:MAG: SAM-dependent methyltransferase, partial [Myxococcota bacterium]